MSDPIINTKITADTAQAEQAIRTVKRSVQDLSESTQSATSLMGTSWTQMATAFGAGSMVAKAIEGVISLIGQIPSAMVSAIKSIDSLKISTIQIAAAITNMQGPKSAAEHYAKASKYAETLAVKLQDVDAKSFANYQTLLAMTNTMTLQGVVLDVNNKKQVDSFTALSNAVAMYTAGQNQSVQAHQEIRALMSGETTQGSILAKQIDDQAKSQGLYKGGLKEIVAEGKKHGDLLERLTPFLVGINAASGDIAKTWEAVTSSAETSGNMIQRIGFAGLYESAVAFGSQAVTWLKAQAEEIGGGIARAWLSVKGIMETISLLFNSQDGSLRMITAAIKSVLGLVNEILYGWAFLLSTVLPTVAEKFNAIVNIMSAVVHMGYAFGAAMIDSIVAVAKAFASFGVGMTKALTGDFAGMKQEFSKIFGADFKTLMEGNVLVMKGTVIAMKEEWSKLKDTSTFNNRFDTFIGKQKATETAEVPIIPPGKPASEKLVDHSSEINTVISDYNRLQQETIKTDQSTTELSRTLGVLEFQNKKSADSFIATYNSSAQARAEFDKQGITLDKINALYVELKNNATVKADNKDYWDGVNARWREGKHEIEQVEQAIKRVFALGKNGDESPLHAFADDVYKSTLAFTQAGDAFGVTAEAYVSAIEGAVSKLTGVTLKGLNSQNTDLAASQVGVDMSTGQVTDPYAQQQAMMEARYQKEFDLIDERTQKIKDAMQAELDSNAPNLTVYGKLQDQMLASSKNRTLHEKQQTIDQKKIDEESFRGRLSAASQYTNMAGQLFSELASTQDQSSRSGFESAKALSLAAAVMSTASAIMAQLTIPGPLGWAGAALAAATGVIQIAKIASTSFGGGGGVSAPAGSYAGGGVTGGASTSQIGSARGSNIVDIVNSRDGKTLDSIADRMGNASLAMGESSKALTKIADIFTTKLGMSFDNAPNQYTNIQGKDGFMQYSGLSAGLSSWKEHTMANILTGGALSAITAIGTGISNALFGGSWKSTGAGITLGVANGELAGQSYITSHKSGGLFSKSKDKTEYSALDANFLANMNSGLDIVTGSVRNAAVTLGQSGTLFDENMKKVNIAAISVATAGRTNTDIQKDVEAAFTSMSNQMITQTLPDLSTYAKGNEAATDTITRLATSLIDVNRMFELVGRRLIDASYAGGDLASRYADAFGGLEPMAKAMDTYFTAMYTEPEQAAKKAALAQQDITAAFTKMGIEIPKTNKAFNDLRTSTTDPELFVALTNLGPTFAEITKQAEELVAAVSSFGADLTSRELSISGQSGLADLYDLKIKQELEMKDAVTNGMDTQWLAVVQQKEFDAAVKTALDAAAKNVATTQKALDDAANNVVATQKALDDVIAAGILSVTNAQKALDDAIAAGVLDIANAQKTLDDMAAKSHMDAMQATSDALLKAAEDLKNRLIAVLDIRSSAAQTLISVLSSNLSPVALYAQTKAEFESTRRLADGGDVAAMKALPDLVTSFIDVSKQFAPSSSVFQSDLASGKQALATLAGIPITADLTLENARAQLLKLEEIREATATGTTEQRVLLSDMSGGLAGMQSLLSEFLSATVSAQQSAAALAAAQLAATAAAEEAARLAALKAQEDAAASALKAQQDAAAALLKAQQDAAASALKAQQDALKAQQDAAAALLAQQNAAANLVKIDTYTSAKGTYSITSQDLVQQYRNGNTDQATFNSQNASAYAPVQTAYDATVAAGITGLTAPIKLAITAADTAANLLDKYLDDKAILDGYIARGVQAIKSNPTGVSPYIMLSQTDTVASDLAAYRSASTAAGLIPAYATGGDHPGGFRIVGEYGPELEATGASRIFNADQTRNIFANGQADNRDMVAELRALREEVRELRNEQKAGHVAIAKNTGESAKQLRRWDGEGTPPVRAAA